MNKGLVYALWDYTAQHPDELSFSEGNAIAVLRRSDDVETEWWWARFNDREGYVPRNLLGVSKHKKLWLKIQQILCRVVYVDGISIIY